jgi:hypothetical protein
VAAPHALEVESFGVRIEVSVDAPDLLAAVEAVLPPRTAPGHDPSASSARFVLRRTDRGLCELARDGGPVGRPAEPEVAVRMLEEGLAAAVAGNATEWTFVSAGVVVAGGRALVLPGGSISGRTTLVKTLVRAGAERYSDRFAVLDPDGWVHPYRGEADRGEPDRSRIGLIATAPYVPGASWAPEPGSASHGALALLAENVSPHDPAQLLAVFAAAASGAVALRGERGEADETAPLLLSALAAAP